MINEVLDELEQLNHTKSFATFFQAKLKKISPPPCTTEHEDVRFDINVSFDRFGQSDCSHRRLPCLWWSYLCWPILICLHKHAKCTSPKGCFSDNLEIRECMFGILKWRWHFGICFYDIKIGKKYLLPVASCKTWYWTRWSTNQILNMFLGGFLWMWVECGWRVRLWILLYP